MKKFLVTVFAIFGIGNTSAQQMHEASAGFDSELVLPFLQQLNDELGLNLDAIALDQFSENLPYDQEAWKDLRVNYQGSEIPLRYQVFKDDPYAPDLYFLTPSEELAASIQSQIDTFFTEHGM
ncbi:hypothetical protein [Halioxenophilus aromaticivorans]|uniref:Uncharacterized protein n=2 Tax=Halioxenophilus aromaticivorans TaxID=1306992 RepID=A0AAV3U2H8_9ALTE